MEQRLSLVTLAVADLPRARDFYARLGWCEATASNAAIAFFDLGGFALALYGRDALAAEVGVDPAGAGFGGVTLAHNVRTVARVDAILAEATDAGGRLVRPASTTSWGGYSGWFADPDGHLWEVAHNPFFPLDARGRLGLGPP